MQEVVFILDSFNRSIHYLRVSVTDRCNLRCQYCMPPEGIPKKKHNEILSLEDFARLIRVATRLGVDKLRLTGGEALLRKNLEYLIEDVSKIETLRDIALTTNGLLLASKADVLAKAGLNRVNVSLDTLKADRFSLLARGGRLEDVLDGIKAARDAGLTPIKINTVLIGGMNDDEIEDLASLAQNGFVEELRFIELMPIGQAAGWAKERFVKNDLVRERLGLLPLPAQEKDSAAQRYALPGGGVIGLIDPVSHNFCGNCSRLRLTADGMLKPCLLTDQEVDIKPSLKMEGDEAIEKAFIEAVNQKGRGNSLIDDQSSAIERDMFRIGG